MVNSPATFIRKFDTLKDNNIYIIVADCAKAYSGGATWMNQENRLTDIENYLNYLNGLYTCFST